MNLITGAAKRDISPTKPLPLCGYPHVERLSTGIHDPLLASALYLRNGGDAVRLVALDLIMLNAGYARPLRKRVAQTLAIPEARVLISCTHSAPVTLRYLQFEMPPMDADYLEFCADQIVDASLEAKQVLYHTGPCGDQSPRYFVNTRLTNPTIQSTLMKTICPVPLGHRLLNFL